MGGAGRDNRCLGLFRVERWICWVDRRDREIAYILVLEEIGFSAGFMSADRRSENRGAESRKYWDNCRKLNKLRKFCSSSFPFYVHEPGK